MTADEMDVKIVAKLNQLRDAKKRKGLLVHDLQAIESKLAQLAS